MSSVSGWSKAINRLERGVGIGHLAGSVPSHTQTRDDINRHPNSHIRQGSRHYIVAPPPLKDSYQVQCQIVWDEQDRAHRGHIAIKPNHHHRRFTKFPTCPNAPSDRQHNFSLLMTPLTRERNNTRRSAFDSSSLQEPREEECAMIHPSQSFTGKCSR